MAVWRTKACDMFGFEANRHSYSSGKIELFADLLHIAARSHEDPRLLDRIVEYVTWATEQTSDELASAVDLAFLLPMFRNPDIYKPLVHRFSPELLATKRAMLMDDTDSKSL